MNKKTELKNKTIVLLVVEAIILFASFLFKNYYLYKGYNTTLVYTMLVLNILIFIAGIAVLGIFLKKPDIYDEKKSIIAISIGFIIFILLNTLIINIINKPLNLLEGTLYLEEFNKFNGLLNIIESNNSIKEEIKNPFENIIQNTQAETNTFKFINMNQISEDPTTNIEESVMQTEEPSELNEIK